MNVYGLIDDNLTVKVNIKVEINKKFNIKRCSYEYGDKLVLYSPITDDVFICDLVIGVFLHLLQNKIPFSMAVCSLTVCRTEYVRAVLKELERMEIIYIVEN